MSGQVPKYDRDLWIACAVVLGAAVFLWLRIIIH